MMKMKLNKKIAGASAMLLLSATMLGTSTFAWFTMSKDVTVTGMELKAKTDNGLVISGDDKATWKTDWDVEMSQGVALFPTSTNANTASANPTWTTATSRYFNDADKNQTGSGSTYRDLTLSYVTTSGTVYGTNEGIGRTSGTNNDYVLKKRFYIKSTGEAEFEKALQIKEVTADVANTTGSGSGNLNKSLRVLIILNDANAYLYAPVDGYDSGTKYKGTETLSCIASDVTTTTAVTRIPNVDANAIKVDMYMYYEGEDANCKSSNITAISVDTLKVSAKFGVAEN